MNRRDKMLKEIPEEYSKEFEPSGKLGLLSTVDQEGYPHISLISSLQAKDSREIIWGQFIEGMSKKNVKINHKCGFAIMNFSMELWRGRTVWTHEEREGDEYIMFNQKPLYRYNSYCGINTVHYMDLVDITETQKLNLASIGWNALLTYLADSKNVKDSRKILKPFAVKLFNRIGNPKFLSYIDSDGYPVIIPILQARTAGLGRIIFSDRPYRGELLDIPEGVKMAVFGLTLSMEDMLLKGVFRGFKRMTGFNMGVFDIEKVYNSMPPVHGYIYPEKKIEPVNEF